MREINFKEKAYIEILRATKGQLSGKDSYLKLKEIKKVIFEDTQDPYLEELNSYYLNDYLETLILLTSIESVRGIEQIIQLEDYYPVLNTENDRKYFEEKASLLDIDLDTVFSFYVDNSLYTLYKRITNDSYLDNLNEITYSAIFELRILNETRESIIEMEEEDNINYTEYDISLYSGEDYLGKHRVVNLDKVADVLNEELDIQDTLDNYIEDNDIEDEENLQIMDFSYTVIPSLILQKDRYRATHRRNQIRFKELFEKDIEDMIQNYYTLNLANYLMNETYIPLRKYTDSLDKYLITTYEYKKEEATQSIFEEDYKVLTTTKATLNGDYLIGTLWKKRFLESEQIEHVIQNEVYLFKYLLPSEVLDRIDGTTLEEENRLLQGELMLINKMTEYMDVGEG